MADETPQDDKTEEPTARRLEKAREDGQVLRSQDLTIAVVTTGFLASVYLLGFYLGPVLLNLYSSSLIISPVALGEPEQLIVRFASFAGDAYSTLSPLFALAILFAIAGATSLDGFVFSGKALAPKISKLNPIKGMARIFGLKALVELVKSILKFLLVGGIASIYFYSNYDQIISLARGDTITAIYSGISFVLFGAIIICSALAVIAAIDVPYQRFDFIKKLKMSKQEIKDEFKEMEGQPEVRQKIKQKQREMAEQRMLQDVPQADVVITNPEHFAVALKYDAESGSAPVLLAKGKGLIAQKIREIASENSIHLFEAPPLARALYFTTEISGHIPKALYVAVAQVIAYVYGLEAMKNAENRPEKPVPKVPKDYQFNEQGLTLN
ncbi:MAG: flagellar biosynthesis protein FlhB [Gammaproteobacteria bacterium]|nr:flagellar biosynthesis protein FlhB [Gammaproteobacteria bacterium]